MKAYWLVLVLLVACDRRSVIVEGKDGSKVHVEVDDNYNNGIAVHITDRPQLLLVPILVPVVSTSRAEACP